MMKYLFLTLLFALSFTATVQAGWKQPNGPYGGIIFAIASTQSGLVTTDGNDIFKWDATKGWVSKYHSPLNLNLVYAYNGTMYAGCNFGTGLLASYDDGETWARPADAPNTLVTSICASDSLIYLGVFNGVVRSTDNGVTWEQRSTGLTVNTVLTFHDSLYIGTFNGLYLSTDGGTTVELVKNGMPANNVFALWTDGNSIVAGTNRGPYISRDRGASWTGPPVPLRSRFVGSIVAHDTVLFMSTDIGVYSTGLQSLSWQLLPGVCPGTVFNLCFFEDTLYAACGGSLAGNTEGGGIFRTTDLGATWASSSRGLSLLSTSSFLSTPDGMLDGTQGAGVFFSSDAGNSWESRLNGLTGASVSSMTYAGNTIVAGLENGVALSSDGGLNWSMHSSGLPGGAPVTSVLVTDTAWFCGATSKGVYKSTNLGASWVASNLGISTSTVTTMFAYDSAIYAATADRGLYRRKANQAVWISISASIASNLFSAIGVHGSRLFAGTNGLGLFYSDDHGDHWTAVNFGIPGGATPIRITGISADGNALIVATADFGIFVSYDNGNSWIDVNSGLGNHSVTAIAMRNHVLYAGTAAGGVWTIPEGDLLGVNENTMGGIPTQFRLGNNYPNPFNPETRIEYSVMTQSNVRLVVYDLLGREVATLVNEVKPAGNYTVSFDASRIASGVYMYSLSTPGFKSVKKMVLAR